MSSRAAGKSGKACRSGTQTPSLRLSELDLLELALLELALLELALLELALLELALLDFMYGVVHLINKMINKIFWRILQLLGVIAFAYGLGSSIPRVLS